MPEQHWFWILVGAVVAAPVWVLFGIIIWTKWLGKVVNDLMRKWILNWPDY